MGHRTNGGRQARGRGASVRRLFAGDGSEVCTVLPVCPACGAGRPIALDESWQVTETKRRSAAIGGPRRLAWAAGHTPIGALMTRDVVCVQEDVSLESLTEILLEKGLHGAPVLDAHGMLSGFVAMTDLVRYAHLCGDTLEVEGAAAPLGDGFHAEELATATVRDVMVPLAFTLEESASLTMAAALMALEGLHRIPVVSAVGEVVGILSALDVMRWLAREDGYLAPEGAGSA